MAAAPPFVCQVTQVHDGDGPIWCRSGQRIRIAGVQAPDFEDALPCRQHRRGYVCDDRLAARSRAIVARMVMAQRLSCQPVDRSYSRIVARCTLPDGRSLSCAVIATGAAMRWDVYWVRYRMGGCH